MAIGIIFAIIFIAIIVGLAVVGFICEPDGWLGRALVIGIIVCALAFIIVPFSWHTINSGEVAVVKHLGKIVDVRGPGTNYDLWITNSYVKYDTKVRSCEISLAAYSADAQPMDVQMTVQYQIDSDKVIDIATQYGKLSILENRIQAIAIEKTKSALSGYKAMNIIENRALMSPKVEEIIMNAVGEEYYVNIVAVVLTNIDFSDAFEQAVEEKMIAEQEKLKADYQNEMKVAKAKADAEAELKTAQGKIEIAKAEAEAKKIAAEAEAKANETISKSLTDKIIEKIYADAWDGKLPSVVGGEGGYMLPSDILN